MPTLFFSYGFRFFFFLLDHEPIHIHVEGSSGDAVFNVVPEIELRENNGLTASELKKVRQAIIENREVIIDRWNELKD
ncbi:MAG: DUF4160 domain-containing protein [Paludibacter sp.]|jgi:hypothetical protein|nr:DUF4160 domain-containing protein [Paludibacter sp.]